MLLINDLTRHAASVQDIVVPAVNRVVGSGWYIMGEECKRFEAEFAAFCGAGHCIGVANGTDALELALRALEMGAGSRVATVANAGFYSMTAMGAIGAEPVFIDVDPVDHLMDLTALREAVAAGQVDAIIVTHLYGLLHDMETVMEVAASGPRRVPVIEDVAQAHGASRGGKRAGSFGDVATFSFYPTKNLGALGDGGAVVARDAPVAARLAALRQYGWRRHYVSDDIGVNSRLDEMQAAILRVKLPHLDAQNARRRAIASAYDEALNGSGIRGPARRGQGEHVFHLYVVQCAERDRLQALLRDQGIGSGIHYPMPVHLQPAYHGRIALGPSLCRETERARDEILSLPIYPELSDFQVEKVCTALHAG